MVHNSKNLYICSMDILERNINNLKKLCVKHNVSELYAFGSVLTNKFQDESDIDLLISFKKIDINEYSDNYFDLKFSLEELFDRKVDLLEEKAIKNPFLKLSIDKSKKLIYGS